MTDAAEDTPQDFKPFGDKTCRHGVLLGHDCAKCIEMIPAAGRGDAEAGEP